MNNDKVSITVLVLTYNPVWEKLKNTLISILNQKNIDFEVIISDDGSKNFYKELVVGFFEKYNFTRYIICESVVNNGTVINLQKALSKSSGKMIRAISPGDYLYDELSLRNWMDYCEKNKIKVSFGNSVYYNDDDEFKIIKHRSAPKSYSFYRKKFSWNMLRKEYLLLDDMALGAAFLADKDILIKYNNMMVNKCKLGDDFLYSLMVFEHGEITCYDKPVVWYEYGHGVSTSNNSRYSAQMMRDWKQMHRIMLNINSQEIFDARFKFLICVNDIIGTNLILWKLFKMIFYPETILWKILLLFIRTNTFKGEINDYYTILDENKIKF